MNLHADAPIGIFDSGIGGLTVAQAIGELLPQEDLIYFGDTAHLPYGDKSEATIQAYSVKIAEVLLRKKCKVIVIACNSASSAAYELLREYAGRNAYILNVIDPMVDYVLKEWDGKTVGLIGTKRTVQSDIYSRKIKESGKDITIHSLATPLLAPMIEEGFFNNQISHDIISQYLSDQSLASIEALILACTHYPLVKKEISEFYDGRVKILDSSAIVAQALQLYLTENNLLNQSAKKQRQFYVSDYTESFEQSTRIFFKEQVHLESYPL